MPDTEALQSRSGPSLHHPTRPTPSPSSETSARLTPDSEDSDSNDDDNVFVEDDIELLGGAGGSENDAYELREVGWDREKRRRQDRADEASYHDGFGRQERKPVSRKGYYTPEEEQAVVRKFDRRLVIFVALLYMLSFLDRSNIGNARIAGMDDDLQSSPRQEGFYEWALTAFYISYIVFEWMSLLWRLVPAHIYVSMLVLSWGVVASLQAVAVNYPMLIFLRTLLGIGEAGFTGIPFYLSFFFKRHELAFRTAIFISAAPLATSFASSLAWLIIKVGEAGPIAPWRLLFLIEGFPSVLIAVIAWNVIPDSPQTASYLTQREKKVARLRLGNERPGRRGGENGSAPSAERLKARDVLAVFRDPVAWITAAMFFLTNMAYSSLPVFLPTILTEMGHDVLTAQALAAPPYLAAFIIVLATAHLSDMMRARTPLIVFHALASAGGYGVLALSRPLHLEAGSMIRYLAVYPAAIGFFNVVVLTIAWSINNQQGASRQGGGFALLQVIGQCGPLVGTHLYPDSSRPFYEGGMRACAVAMLVVAALALVLRLYLVRLNRKLDAAVEEDADERAEQEGLVAGSRRGESFARESFRFML